MAGQPHAPGVPRAAWLGAALLFACAPEPHDLFVPEDPGEFQRAIPPVVLAAGDIGSCDPGSGTAATARLLDEIPGTILALGDIAYPDGSPSSYRGCYDRSWGRHRTRTRPVPGNHDYEFADGAQYYAYFDSAAGEPGKGYYSFEIGNWLLMALNSEIDIGAGSRQANWLRETLSSSPARCSLVFLHRPRFSSGRHGDDLGLRPMWEILQAGGVDLVLSGHDHHYERFAPQDPLGRPDPNGIRQFIVGTGGAYVSVPAGRAANSEARDGATFGVLRLMLKPDRYAWEFVPVAGSEFSDSGSTSCR